MSNLYLNILVITCFLFAFALIASLLSNVGADIDRRKRRMDFIADKKNENEIFTELNQSFYKRIVAPKFNGILSTLSSMFPFLVGNEKTSQDLARQLRLAGMNVSVGMYMAGKSVFMIAVVVLTCILAVSFSGQGMMTVLGIFCVGLIVALMFPKMQLNSKVNARQGEIRRQLPDAIDLLSVCVEAGLSFDAGILKITEKMSGPFMDELKNMYRELQMGRPRREALKNLGEGSDIDELKTFTSAVIQADQMGIPIKNILKVQSAQLRLARKQRAQETGMKAPVKMLFPMIVFIFPALFIVILGPSVLNIMNNLM